MTTPLGWAQCLAILRAVLFFNWANGSLFSGNGVVFDKYKNVFVYESSCPCYRSFTDIRNHCTFFFFKSGHHALSVIQFWLCDICIRSKITASDKGGGGYCRGDRSVYSCINNIYMYVVGRGDQSHARSLARSLANMSQTMAAVGRHASVGLDIAVPTWPLWWYSSKLVIAWENIIICVLVAPNDTFLKLIYHCLHEIFIENMLFVVENLP